MKRLSTALLAVAGAMPAAAQRTVHAPLAAQLPSETRALAMGGTTAASRDAAAALGNPALAGAATIAALAVARYGGNARGGALASSSTVGVIGLGVAASYLDYGAGFAGYARLSNDVVWRDGPGSGASLAAAFALSTTVKGMRWGAAATYLEERVDVERASVIALTVGMARDAFLWGTSLGVAVQNLGPSLHLAGEKVPLPARLAVGLSRSVFPRLSWLDIALAGGVAVRRDGLVSGSLGGEFAWVPIEGVSVALRGGARRPELRAQRPMTTGLGVAIDRFALDYAWEQLRAGGAHRVGLRIR